MLERLFKVRTYGSNGRREVLAGLTTFMTMSYIIIVQPTMLKDCGMDFGAVFVATCLASAVACYLMGLYANYPIALAPAMGHNAFFVYTVCLKMGVSWQVALGAVFISGTIFVLIMVGGLLLGTAGLRERLVNAVPGCLKNGIAVGIGLFIALIGFQYGGIIRSDPATFVTLGNMKDPVVLTALFGIGLIVFLMVFKVRGAILWGILAVGAVCTVAGKLLPPEHFVSMPPSIAPTFLKLDIRGALSVGLIQVIFVFFFLDLFDTVGTLIGVGQEGGFVKDGKLPRARQALFSDAVGTVSGALLGTSTVTSYIESASGISAGGRTGLANMVTGTLFLVSLFLYPVFRWLGSDVPGGLHPVIAPALVVVGCLMMKSVVRIKWDDITEAFPAFLTITVIPLGFNITEGISFGFISFAFLKLVSGRAREVHWIIYLFAALFVLRYIVL